MSSTLALFEEEKLKLVDVAVPLPIKDSYTYQIPEQFLDQVQVGCRLRIPFKNRTMIGYAVGIGSDRPVQNPKDILEVLDMAFMGHFEAHHTNG